VVLLSYLVNGVINLRIDNPSQRWSVFFWSLACMAIVFALTVTHIASTARGWPVWRQTISLSVQALATYLPFVLLHQIWGGMAGYVAGSFLLLLRRPLAWVFFGAVVASMYVFAEANYHDWSWITYYIIATMLLGLVIYGLTRLSELVIELAAMRGELARMAVTQERLRFARDLHDLLGYSLSSITLKAELAYRLVPNQPERAKRELTEILDASRQALADVREVASSYRDMSLRAEAAAAKRMLETAEIDANVSILLSGPLPADLDTALATTLREGVTNILRHSKVQHCMISATQTDATIRLELANDGVVEQDSGGEAHSGSGLGNLRSRLAGFGGTLTAGVGPDHRFRLVAEVPVVREAPGPDNGGGGSGDGQADQTPVG
jgi:two-component system sensor histidine kinase DesK